MCSDPSSSAPTWDLTPLYASFEAQEFLDDIAWLREQVGALASFMDTEDICATSSRIDADDVGARLEAVLARINDITTRFSRVYCYIACHVSTDSFNATARKYESQMDMLGVQFHMLTVRFQSWLKTIDAKDGALSAAIDTNETAQLHRFYLTETAEQSRYMMSSDEEQLAAELRLSGGDAFAKLHGTVTSQATAPFVVDGEEKELPITQIRNYGSSPDEDVRRRAFDAEYAVWENMGEVLAACLNGVKGHMLTVTARRGREDSLHQSLDQARISRDILDTLLGVMQESFPVFRRYWHAKARVLGKPQLAWWDLRAPVGRVTKEYTCKEACDLIAGQFGTFSDELSGLVRRAYEERWIDAEPRRGKRGGAFCMPIQALEQSRVMCNFDGTFNAMTTLAHELGHAFHNYCLRGMTPVNRRTPMTLAETASIFCETIVTNAALRNATDAAEECALLETYLTSAAQIIVDIYSRFIFEKGVCERRVSGSLSVEEITTLMLNAQEESYGDAVDAAHRNAYAWAWKPHYYSTDRAYYNYPYAFGLLFGLGLYAVYEERGPSFVPEYMTLLSRTGMARPAELAAAFDSDITAPDFWRGSCAIIEQKIARYCALSEELIAEKEGNGR